MNGLITNCPDSPKIGFVISYQCTEGYILQGNSSREYLPGGNWTGTDPTCSSKFTNVSFVYVIHATKINVTCLLICSLKVGIIDSYWRAA